MGALELLAPMHAYIEAALSRDPKSASLFVMLQQVGHALPA